MKLIKIFFKIGDKWLDVVDKIFKKINNFIKQKMEERAEETKIYKEEYKKFKLDAIRIRAKKDAIEGKSTFSEIGKSFGDFNKLNEPFQSPQNKEKEPVINDDINNNLSSNLSNYLENELNPSKKKKKDTYF